MALARCQTQQWVVSLDLRLLSPLRCAENTAFCTYVYTYIYIYIHLYAYTCTYVYAYTFAYIHMPIHVHKHMHIHVHIHMHLHIHIDIDKPGCQHLAFSTQSVHVSSGEQTCIQVHTCLPVYLRAYVRTYVQTHIHVYMLDILDIRTYIHIHTYT